MSIHLDAFFFCSYGMRRLISGVKKLRLIDFDYVTLSSLNRHATATRADVGSPKALSIKRTVKSIAPWIEVEALVELWNVDNEKKHHWLDGADWVIDGIDNIDTKVSYSYGTAQNGHLIAFIG